MKILGSAVPIHGHTIPALRVIKRLAAQGHDVQMLCQDEGMSRFIERHGVKVQVLPLKPHLELMTHVRRLLEAEQPDATVCDWSRELWLALHAWRPRCRVSILRCEQFVGYQRRNFLLPDKFGFENPHHVKWLNQSFREQGLAPLSDPRDLYSAEIIIVPSIPELDPLPENAAEIYPSTTFIYSGPLLLPVFGEALPESVTEWLAGARRDQLPVLLVTLGTVWGKHLYTMLAACFRQRDLAVLMVVPDEEQRTQLQAERGPRLEVIGGCDLQGIAAQCDVVLHHCGHGTLQAVLLAAKPSLTIPSGEYDREDNAVRLEELQCSRHLSTEQFRHGFDGVELERQVRDILDSDAISAGVRRVSLKLKQYMASDPLAAAVDAIAQRIPEVSK